MDLYGRYREMKNTYIEIDPQKDYLFTCVVIAETTRIVKLKLKTALRTISLGSAVSWLKVAHHRNQLYFILIVPHDSFR